VYALKDPDGTVMSTGAGRQFKFQRAEALVLGCIDVEICNQRRI